MANPEHVAKLKEGKAVWDYWRRGSELPDLRRVDLRGFRLAAPNFETVNLVVANLFQAQLTGADLRGVLLTGANLSESDLSKANLTGADLRGANLGGADLSGCHLSRAHLGGTVFAGTNLNGADGLDTCSHAGPSFIDFQTLAISNSLPLPFLRGCGLPDVLIDYLPSLLRQPIQFYSCFISYSTRDQEFAERLHADLQNKGGRCWFAPHNVLGGRKLHEQIDEAIRIYDRLLLILSENSMNSEWVRTEIAHARQKESVQGRQVLFPISLVPFNAVRDWKCFDADTGKDSAREIREYFIPDFSSWTDHDSYKTALERLVKDLKTTDG